MNPNRERKILHSYYLIFRDNFLDEMILHPNYSLLYTLDVPAASFNCAINLNIDSDNIDEELDQIESYYKIRQKDSNISIEPASQPSNLIEKLIQRGYEYNPPENCTMWSRPVLENNLEANKDIKFEIVNDFNEFQDYLELTTKGWSDLFDYSKYAASLSKLYQKNHDGVNTQHIVGYLNNKPVCTATLGMYFEMAHLINISVLKEYRRKGIASELIRFSTEIAKKSGADNLFVDIDSIDEAGESLLTKRGFKKELTQLIYTKKI